jgi:hypothetical protein
LKVELLNGKIPSLEKVRVPAKVYQCWSRFTQEIIAPTAMSGTYLLQVYKPSYQNTQQGNNQARPNYTPTD